MAKRALDIIIAAHNQSQAAFGQVKGQLSGLTSSLGSLKGMLAGALGGYALLRIAKDSIAAFGEEQQAIQNLSDALNLLGAGGEQAVQDMKKFASSIQDQTIIADDAVLEMMALGASLGKLSGESLQDATIAAIGLSRSLKTDTTSAMRLVARAAQGNTSTLSRYGIVLDNTLSPQEKFNALLEIGANNFSLATGEAQTSTGKLEQFKNSIDELKEALGEQLMPVLIEMTDYISKHQEGVKNSTQVVGFFGKALIWLGEATQWTGDKLGYLAGQLMVADAKFVDFLSHGQISVKDRLSWTANTAAPGRSPTAGGGISPFGGEGAGGPPERSPEDIAKALVSAQQEAEILKIKLAEEGQAEEEKLMNQKYQREIAAAQDSAELKKQLEENLQTELATIRKKYADKAAEEQQKELENWQKERMDFSKNMGEEIQRLMIENTKTGLDKEMALLDLEESKALEEARRLNFDLDAVRLRFELDRNKLRQEDAERGGTGEPAGGGGFLEARTQLVGGPALGEYKPYAELERINQEQLKKQDRQLVLSEQAQLLLERIALKLESGETVVLNAADLDG